MPRAYTFPNKSEERCTDFSKEKLNKLRNENRLYVKDLAFMCSINYAAFASYCDVGSLRMPTLKQAKRIADVFGVDVKELLNEI